MAMKATVLGGGETIQAVRQETEMRDGVRHIRLFVNHPQPPGGFCRVDLAEPLTAGPGGELVEFEIIYEPRIDPLPEPLRIPEGSTVTAAWWGYP